MKKLALIALVFAFSGAGVANAATYELDPDHTNARFAIDHFATTTNVGGIYGITGELEFDRTKGTGSIDVTLPIANLQTGSEHFTEHLKSADLFSADKYPSMQFVSTKFNFTGKGATRKLASVDGKLTLLGKTHPVRLTATKFNCYNSPMLNKEVCGGDFTATIDRTKWGMNFLVDSGMTKNVRLDIQIEAAKK